MLKKILIASLMLLPFTSPAQLVYESLKKVYTAQYVFEHREKGDSFKFIQDELKKIEDPELKQWTICAIAINVHGYGFVDNKKLLSLIDNVIAKPQTEIIKKVALDVKSEITRTLIHTKIQDISLPTVKGDSLNLASCYSSGFDYVVVDLWATWCSPCIAEMKKFNAFRKQYNIEFYSISIDHDLEKVQKFMAKNSTYTWPIVWTGEESSLQDYFKGRLIPAFFIVNKEGIIVSHVVGKGLEDELKNLYKR